MIKALSLSLEPKMTVKEVSEILKVSDKHVRKTVSELFPEKMINGITTYLNEIEVTAVKLKIEKNPHLNQSVQVKTDLEKELLIQQAMQFQAEKINAMQERLSIAEPLAELAITALRDESKHYSITDAGKHLGLRQTEIFAILRAKRMLTVENLPSQYSIDCGVLTLRTNVVGTKNYPQSIMTMQNIDNFRKMYL